MSDCPTVILADSFSEATAPHEEIDPIGHFLHQLADLADELKEGTLTPQACDQWLADSPQLFSAAIVINLACQRIKNRAQETRGERRLAEIA